MKIAMLRPSYKPDLSAGNHLASDLVEDLISKGHKIELIVPTSEKFDFKNVPDYGYTVHRVKSKIQGNSTLSRMLKYIHTSIKMATQLLKITDVDIIFTHSMPPTIGPLSVMIGKLKKIPVIYWEQDIVSESIISTGITKNPTQKRFFYKISRFIENISLKGSDHIITISNKFKDIRILEGIDKEKITVVYNWIDTDVVYPVERDDNFIFNKYNLDKDKFYVTYCGNLGIPQNVEIMIDAAKMLEDKKDIQFIIFGEGSREIDIKKYIKYKNTKNLSLFPLEPLENTKYVYSVGDIGLVIAKKGTSNNGFPSKTWTIMSSGQAIISCFDIDSDLSDFVVESKSGFSIVPDNAMVLKKKILEIYNMEDMGKSLGMNGRSFVEKKMSRKMSTNKIIKIIESIE